jgi:4-alpha-glucanotransferase
MNLQRSSGILLHPTSLPGGRLGPEAHRFVDWLQEAGQSWWQVLPLGPPDDFGSPYAAASAFAGWRGLLADPDAAVEQNELEAFVAGHPYWIGDWAAFAGIGAVADQVRFQREWDALRAYAAERGVRLIGDLPLYVAPGSADHLAHPELFQRGAVAGCPPDSFTRMGQLWGNPLYDWAAMRATGYRWWIERFRRTFELVDLVRVDHFRGLVAYWTVPDRYKTARRGVWRRGPGRELFDAVRAELGALPLIAEDLGVITRPVVRLRDELGLPGMHVLQFAPRVDHHRENAVVYTGTHDNDTTVGWSGEPAAHWRYIELAFSSRARLAIIPAQDVLGLGSKARMNFPGRAAGNWRWRLRPGQLTAEHAARLRELAARYRRL